MTTLGRVILTDRRGAIWVCSSDYQESNTREPGWLEMTSTFGETMPYPDVVKLYGFTDRQDPYLLGRWASE